MTKAEGSTRLHLLVAPFLAARRCTPGRPFDPKRKTEPRLIVHEDATPIDDLLGETKRWTCPHCETIVTKERVK